MRDRGRISALVHRIWDQTGGAVTNANKPLPTPPEPDFHEPTDDGLEPMPWWMKAFYGTVVVAIILAIAAWFLKDYEDRWSYLETLFLALTLIGVAWNTVYTRKMQQSMVQQINVTILPIFEVHIAAAGQKIPDRGDGARYATSFFKLKNVGQGVALDIEIDPLLVQHGYGELISWGEPLWFERVTSLSPGQETVVQDVQRHDKDRLSQANFIRRDLLALLVAPGALDNYEMVIRYTDILGNKYAQVYHLGRRGNWPGGVQLNKNVRKVTINVDGKSYGHKKPIDAASDNVSK